MFVWGDVANVVFYLITKFWKNQWRKSTLFGLSSGVAGCACLGCLAGEGDTKLYWTSHLWLTYVRHSELCAGCPIKAWMGVSPTTYCSSTSYQHSMHCISLPFIFLTFCPLPFHFSVTCCWEWGLRLAPIVDRSHLVCKPIYHLPTFASWLLCLTRAQLDQQGIIL